MTSKYLTPDDPDAFLDYPEQPQPVDSRADYTAKCPKCKGHGGWNLAPFAFPPRSGREDTAENRHKWQHFKASCQHCCGWGWVTPEEAEHIHEWDAGVRTGNCLHVYTCKICGKQREIDSSD